MHFKLLIFFFRIVGKLISSLLLAINLTKNMQVQQLPSPINK